MCSKTYSELCGLLIGSGVSLLFLIGCQSLPEKHACQGEECAIITDSLFRTSPPKLQPTGDQLWKTTKAFSYVDLSGKTWMAPVGTITDGASIPAIFTPIIGERFDKNYVEAAIIHDAYCARINHDHLNYKSEPWERVHRMFYEAALKNGTDPVRAKLMYAAIYLGGPRWGDPDRRLDRVTHVHLIQEYKWCKTWIERDNPKVGKITEWMRNREKMLQENRQTVPSFIIDKAK